MNPAAVSRTSADGVTAVQPVTDVAEADQSLSDIGVFMRASSDEQDQLPEQLA